MATKLYRQLCPDALPSAFNLMGYTKIKKYLLALDEKDLTLSDVKRIGKLKLVLKIIDVSFAIIITIAIWVFIKQGLKFV